MGTRTIRRTSVTLPSLDELDPHLSHLTSLGTGDRVTEFRYEDAELRALDLTGTHLIDGRVTGISTQQTRLDELRVDSVEFTGCDLASLRWTDSKITRCCFRDCKLLGATLDDITLDDVCFDNCKLDYSTFTRLRATGPVIFTRCSLRETTFDACDLSTAAFDNCDLRLTEFNDGTYRGMDLRGNDLSQLRGITALKQIIIDQTQTAQLATALATELDITYGDDLDET